MATIPAQEVNEARKLEVERLDAALAAIWEKVVTGNLWAIDRLLKISEQRCRLLGLNAPDRQVIITEEMISAEINRIEEQMRVNAVITGVPVPELEAGDDE
jgi:5,10-methylene-tetrahydrofolate dehydrogenase/methenyl tetrahydrofolate cyclohydrolase